MRGVLYIFAILSCSVHLIKRAPWILVSGVARKGQQKAFKAEGRRQTVSWATQTGPLPPEFPKANLPSRLCGERFTRKPADFPKVTGHRDYSYRRSQGGPRGPSVWAGFLLFQRYPGSHKSMCLVKNNNNKSSFNSYHRPACRTTNDSNRLMK